MNRFCILALTMISLGASALPAQDAAWVRAVPRPAAVLPDTGLSQGILVSVVSVGNYDSALPCFMCVRGATQNNLGISQPLSWIQSGTTVTFTIVADDAAYSGPCSFVYSVRQGGTLGQVLMHGQQVVAGGCYPAGWYAAFNARVPSNPGVYDLEGIVDAGGTVAVMKVPIVIQ